MKRKVVLIAPSPYDLSNESNARHFVAPPSIPLAIVSLGSFLHQNDVPVELIDVQMDVGFGLTGAAEQKVIKDVVAHLCAQSEDILWVCISCDGQPASLSSPRARNGLLLGQQIKSALPDIPLIFSGYFPSVHYHSLLQYYDFIDGILFGDGELTALKVSRHLIQRLLLSTLTLPNWIHRDKNSKLIEPANLLLQGLDTSPTLDFTLLRHYEKYPIATFITSRGCPYSCSFCAEPAVRSYHPIETSKLTKDLSHYDRVLPCERVFVFDPTFGIGRQHTTRVIELFEKTKFKFFLASRADVLDPELIVNLKKAGVEWISLGLETVSFSTLLRMSKVKSRSHYDQYLDGARKIIASCFTNNITVSIGLMLGYPGDMQEDTQAILDFVQWVADFHEQKRQETGNAPGFAAFPNYVKAYPKTPLFKSLQKYPETNFLKHGFLGEYLVADPSPGYTFDELREHVEAVEQAGVFTNVAKDRMVRYVGFLLDPLLADHPELVTDDDVVVWRDTIQTCLSEQASLRRYSSVR